MIPINLFAVFLAALSAFLLGFLLHGPIAGKLWMRLANIHPTGSEKLSDMLPQLAWNFLTNLMTAFMLAIVSLLADSSEYLIGDGMLRGAALGVIVWGGFIATSSAVEVIWMGRSFKLWLFEVVCSLLTMTTMGLVVGGM